ncbi:hypothetical protein N8T08_006678 [Aspergillus melleus]|uniref:Uncharacterized protein n=1 Tax=Aspergillus melleus TaxID=138277 RepID=A0ACC3BFT7_9EURO|nr:hypothetical protein N8T08_006678 [Aspergillus melleus]
MRSLPSAYLRVGIYFHVLNRLTFLVLSQKVIKDTFSLADVPKEALYLGMAGVVPYLATSLETVYLSYEIGRSAAGNDGLIFSGQTAELLLHMIEPIQVGYGAVVSRYLAGPFKRQTDREQ